MVMLVCDIFFVMMLVGNTLLVMIMLVRVMMLSGAMLAMMVFVMM